MGCIPCRCWRQAYRTMMRGVQKPMWDTALPRWRILLALHEAGALSQKVLAERCRLDPASLTRQLQAMESLGMDQPRHR